MESRIVFLGTGAGKYVRSKQIRATGGVVVQAEGLSLHIDPGPGSLLMAKNCRINPRENNVILISHNHIGHCNDVNALIDAMTYGGDDRQGILVAAEAMINGSDEEAPYLTKFHRNCLERVISVKSGQRVGVNDIEIVALPSDHTEDSIGFKIMTKEFTLCYTGDTSYDKEIVESYKGADIMIFNVPYPSDKKPKDEKQLCSDDVVKIIEKVKPSLSIITHFSNDMIEADPIYEAREIQKKAGTQVIAAKDGMSINPAAYSAKSKQKSLKSF